MNVNVRSVSGPNAMVQARALQEGSQRNQRARALQERGNYQAAERLHKEALDIKLAAFGMSHPTTAISYNALGEVYIKLHRLDEAEDHLQNALTIAMRLNPLLDQAGYRENLAVVYEMRGDLDKARAIRLEGSQNAMLCAYEKCPNTTPCSVNELLRCSRCKSIYYCAAPCQRIDWRRHKAYCKARSP